VNRWPEKRFASSSSTNAAAKSPAVIRLSPAALTTGRTLYVADEDHETVR
jgi:hypothetical protein